MSDAEREEFLRIRRENKAITEKYRLEHPEETEPKVAETLDERIDADTLGGLTLEEILYKARMMSGGGGTSGSGIYKLAPSYTIYKVGTTYYAMDEDGNVDFSGTDASTVIQSAINALTNGGKIFIKAGTYVINTSIYITSNIVFNGEGFATILRQGNDRNLTAIIIVDGETVDKENIMIKDLQVDGNGSQQTGIDTTINHGINLRYKTSRVVIQGVYVHSAKNLGITLYSGNGARNSSEISIIGNVASGNLRDGIALDFNHHDINIIGNLCFNNLDFGIGTAISVERINIIGNTVFVSGTQGQRTGIYLGVGKHNIVGNYVNGGIYGIRISAGWNAVYGNFVTGQSTAGIYLTSLYAHVTNNYSYQTGSTTHILLSGTGNYNTITNNYIVNGQNGGDNLSDGILLQDGASYNRIMFNTIEGYSVAHRLKSGVTEQGTANYNQIRNNIFNYIITPVIKVGSNTNVKDNIGYVTENSGTATGTGAQQTIAHGCAFTPTYDEVFLSERSTGGANAYQSAVPDATNIYVLAVLNKTYNWKIEKA